MGLYEGTFLLAALHQQEASSIFGLAITWSNSLFPVYNAYFDYLLPQIARVPNRNELPVFLLRAYFGTSLLILCGVPVCWFIGEFVPHLLRRELHAAVPIFYTLSLSM